MRTYDEAAAAAKDEWVWECRRPCEWESQRFDPYARGEVVTARSSARAHVARQVVQAIQVATDEATGSGQPTRDDATDAAVPAGMEPTW